MDDGSSISSGEISDAVAGVSTDDNITVGSSLSAHSFSADRAGLASQRAAVLHMGSVTLQTSSARRHAAAERTTLPVSSAREQRSLTAGGAVFIRRSNQAVVTDLKARTLRSGTAVAIDDPARCLATVASSSSSSNSAVKQKKDSETNTDNSALMMLAQRSRLAGEYSGNTAARPTDRHRSLTPRRLTSVTSDNQQTDSARASSLGRTQSDSRPRDGRDPGKRAVSETDDFDDVAYNYYSNSVSRTGQPRYPGDDQQTPAAVYHSDMSHHLSASGGQYTLHTNTASSLQLHSILYYTYTESFKLQSSSCSFTK